jgi:heat shock protein HslJ
MKKMLVLLSLIALAACTAAPKVDLSGEWRLVSYGDAASATPALPGVDTSIKFEDGQMSGNVGCNGFGGGYELQGAKITFSGIMSTMMYCEETSIQEQGVLAIMADNVQMQVQINGNILTITSTDGSSALTLQRK